ncbi:MAG: hypothetical protein JNK12_12880 [Acidimicrobiales bacterium]|nr:hypothetical protein [Acidimicrobiales bacterium]
MRRVVALLLLGGVLGLGAGACGSDASPEESAAPPIHAEILRSRLFELQHQLKLVLRNDGDQPIDVEALQLDLPTFEQVDPQERHSSLVPGRAVAIPVDFGDARCPPAGDAASAVVLTIAGEPRRIPLAEPSDALAVLNERQCLERRVHDAFAITWGEDDLRPAGELAVGTTLDVDRLQPDHTLDIELVRSSVVINLSAVGGGHPSLALDAAENQASVDVVFNASRCDSHALTESKKTFVFVAELRLDDGPVIPIELPAEGALRRQLEEYLEACH